MPDFKLISADSHVNEPPAAWERVQKEYGERAPRVVRDPPDRPKGIWLVIEGIPPIGLSHYSKGQVVSKDKGISDVEQEKHFETIRFNEQFRYEDYPGGWEPAARLKDQDTDGIEAEILFPAPRGSFIVLSMSLFNAPSFAPTTIGCTISAAIAPNDSSAWQRFRFWTLSIRWRTFYITRRSVFVVCKFRRASKIAAITNPSTSPCGRRWKKPE